MTSGDLCLTFDHGNDLRVPQRSWWPNLAAVGHSWTNWPLDDLWPVGSRRKVDGSPQLAKPYPLAKFQLCRLKHSRKHSETDRHGKFINIDLTLVLLRGGCNNPSNSFRPGAQNRTAMGQNCSGYLQVHPFPSFLAKKFRNYHLHRG